MKIKYILPFSILLFFGLLFAAPTGFISSDSASIILTINTFLFGIIAGFYIVVTTTDYNSVKNLIGEETAAWITLHQNVSIYDKSLGDKLTLLIDEYVRKAFDFEIIEYTKNTFSEFENIRKFIATLPIKQEMSSIYEQIDNTLGNITNHRQQLFILGAKTLSVYQWLVLLVLAAILIISLYGARTGELFFDIVVVAVSSATILILFMIRELDLYVWNEKTFSFDVFENVFRSIGQLPYYPEESIMKGRITPQGIEYRIGKRVYSEGRASRKLEVIKQKVNN